MFHFLVAPEWAAAGNYHAFFCRDEHCGARNVRFDSRTTNSVDSLLPDGRLGAENACDPGSFSGRSGGQWRAFTRGPQPCAAYRGAAVDASAQKTSASWAGARQCFRDVRGVGRRRAQACFLCGGGANALPASANKLPEKVL
jgi:hypothetical protein